MEKIILTITPKLNKFKIKYIWMKVKSSTNKLFENKNKRKLFIYLLVGIFLLAQ